MRPSRARSGIGLIALATVVAAVGVATRTSIVVLLAVLIVIGGLLVLDRFPVDRRW